jgi:serine/threonine protein kinase
MLLLCTGFPASDCNMSHVTCDLNAQVLMRCLIDAVSHMHNHGISHRDLKLENLVFGRSKDLQSITVVDFGLAKAARARERMEGVTGTLWYTAPEILLGVAYSPLVDMWSLGVVMYVAITGALSALN